MQSLGGKTGQPLRTSNKPVMERAQQTTSDISETVFATLEKLKEDLTRVKRVNRPQRIKKIRNSLSKLTEEMHLLRSSCNSGELTRRVEKAEKRIDKLSAVVEDTGLVTREDLASALLHAGITNTGETQLPPRNAYNIKSHELLVGQAHTPTLKRKPAALCAGDDLPFPHKPVPSHSLSNTTTPFSVVPPSEAYVPICGVGNTRPEPPAVTGLCSTPKSHVSSKRVMSSQSTEAETYPPTKRRKPCSVTTSSISSLREFVEDADEILSQYSSIFGLQNALVR